MTIPSIVRIYLLLFFLKVSLLSLFFIPRWETPDESGHFSYISDIAEGRGIPVLGKSRMVNFFYDDLDYPVDTPEVNWIAQHPPLYYLLMAPAYKVAQWTGAGLTQTVHWLRILNAAITTIFLYLLYCFGRTLMPKGEIISFTGLCIVGSVPMFSNIAAGINNTMLLGLLFTAGLWQTSCYLNQRKTRYLYWAGVFMGLAGFTKYTALPAIAAWGLLLAVEAKVWKSLKHFKILTLTAVLCMSPIVLWSLRNYIILGTPLPLSFNPEGEPKLDLGFFQYLAKYRIFESYYRGFWSQLGWIGVPGDGRASLLTLPRGMLPFYGGLLVLFAGSAFCYALKGFFAGDSRKNRLFAAAIILIVTATATRILVPTSNSWIQIGLGLWLAGFLLAMYRTVYGEHDEREYPFHIQAAACIILISFLIPLVSESFEATRYSGFLRASWGRYFFPFSGLLMAGLVFPGLKQLSRLGNWIILLPIATQAAECWLWVYHAAPFYQR